MELFSPFWAQHHDHLRPWPLQDHSHDELKIKYQSYLQNSSTRPLLIRIAPKCSTPQWGVKLHFTGQLQTTTIFWQSLLFVAIFMIEIFIVAISSDRERLFILLTLWDRNGSNCVQNSRNPDAPPPSPSNISSLKWWRCYQKLVKKMAVMMMIISFGHTGFELSKYPFQQLIGISWGRSASVIV